MPTHSEELSDQWSIETVAGQELFLVNFTISGSAGSDGVYPGGSPVKLVADGDRWSINMTFVELAGGGPVPAGKIPLPAQVFRVASHDRTNGLVESFNNVPGGLLEPDVGQPVLICRNLDPSVKPFAGLKNPYDFTYQRKMLRQAATATG